ncbi:MAG TPA: Hsp20/alpha crystallin family protein [Candidatus Paceibacterota bacterium]|nr:Hsp20/alpha crystallin family protein [Candidatus Paceibacterota bacterium]
MKKRSFFERLAGNLRFNDVEDEMDEQVEDVRPVRKAVLTERAPEPEKRRELPVSNFLREEEDEDEEGPAAIHLQEEEEIGQLPVDVYETPHEVIIQTLIAGVLPEHLKIDITRDVIAISGKREENKAISQDSYHVQELYWGSFERVINLPIEVDIDNAEAIERHGLLMIKLPKLDKGRKAALKIKSI